MQQVITHKISCVDLFCGVGGLTHGLELEGIDVKAGFDLDSACKYPYEANNKAKFVFQDVSELGEPELSQHFGDSPIRILAGCAPCQPFSTYRQGKNNESDHKWGLIGHFQRLVEESLPEIVTMENVPKVARHRVFDDFLSSLEKLGYKVKATVVNCADYGVPQSRKRMVVLASRLGPIELIPPTQAKHKTVRQTIIRYKPIKAGAGSERDRLHVSAKLSPKNLRRIQASKPGGTWRDWPSDLVADCHKSEKGRTYPSVYGRMQWDKPSPTITTQCYGFGNGRFGHPEQDRAISLREAARLQSFPRKYKFVDTGNPVEIKNVGRLIGNAVPVELGRAIARSIFRHLTEVMSKPEYDQTN